MKAKMSWIKKIFIALTAVFFLIVCAAILLPFVVDVNQYKPILLTKINERINGELELGHLKLSLWGRLNVDVDGLKLYDQEKKLMVEVKDANLHIPFLSLLSSRPEIQFQLQNPKIFLTKDAQGEFNFAKLAKKEKDEGSSSAAPTQTTTSKDEGFTIPALLVHSRYSLKIVDAALNYKDEATKDHYQVQRLSMTFKDVSLQTSIPFEMTAELDLKLQNQLQIEGPIALSGSMKAQEEKGAFQRLQLQATLDLSDARVQYSDSFEKPKKTTFKSQIEGTVSSNRLDFNVFRLYVGPVSLDSSLNFQMTENGPAQLNMKGSLQPLDLSQLSTILPMVKDYKLSGYIDLPRFSLDGPVSALTYAAEVKCTKVMLNHDLLRQPLEVNGTLVLEPNQVKNMSIAMQAAQFDLKLSGSVENLSAPRFKLNLQSQQMNLDELLKASSEAAEKRRQAAEDSVKSPSAHQPSKNTVVNYNDLFKPLRENPVFSKASGSLEFQIQDLFTTGIHIQKLNGEFLLNQLMMKLMPLSMDVFGGSVKGSVSIDLKQPKPALATQMMLSGFQSQKMMESHVPLARNTIKGIISAQLNLGGQGLNWEDINSDWKGSGNVELKDAVFSTLDVAQQIRAGVLQKLPQPLQEKIKIPDSLLNQQSAYDSFLMKFQLADGVLTLTEVQGKAEPNKGLDVKGNGTLKLSHYALDLNLDVIDTYNLTGGDEVVKDSRFGHFTVSPKIKGTLFSPKFDWGATLGKLAKSAAQTAVTKHGQQALEKAIGGSKGAKQVLKKIFEGSSSSEGKEDEKQKEPVKPKEEAKKLIKGLFGK